MNSNYNLFWLFIYFFIFKKERTKKNRQMKKFTKSTIEQQMINIIFKIFQIFTSLYWRVKRAIFNLMIDWKKNYFILFLFHEQNNVK